MIGVEFWIEFDSTGLKTRIGIAIGPYEGLLTKVKRSRLKWHGRVTRSS